ncbi:MAG: thiopurine S-methyltransferase [Woeseiaceae bacterium]
MGEAWLERWQEGRIGWHEEDGNRSLKKHWTASGKRVLVPLCGKSVDMLWLEGQGNEVYGIELSGIAVRAFFDENELDFEEYDGARHRFVAIDRRITIIRGDYFEFSGELFDACYDRGAFAALPAAARPNYAEHTSALLLPGAYHLLLTLEYDQSLVAGPPFSTTAEEVDRYWPSLERIDAYDDIENGPPKFHDAGVGEMFEVVWRSAATTERR